MEHLVSFLPGQFPRKELFEIELTGITYPDAGYSIRREKSDIYCLEYIIDGYGYVKCDGQTFYPGKGDVYLLPAGMTHEYHALEENPFEKIWMNVRGSLCDHLYQEYGLEGHYHFPDCPLYPLFRRFLKVCEEYSGNNREFPGRELSIQELSLQAELIFHEILGNLADHVRGDDIRQKNAAGIAREYMDLNVYKKITVEELGREVGLSPTQLTRVFKQEYGQTPYQYFLQNKLATACLLLRNTNLQVQEIAERLQFQDAHYFSGLFHEKMGVTPKEYRRNVVTSA